MQFNISVKVLKDDDGKLVHAVEYKQFDAIMKIFLNRMSAQTELLRKVQDLLYQHQRGESGDFLGFALDAIEKANVDWELSSKGTLKEADIEAQEGEGSDQMIKHYD